MSRTFTFRSKDKPSVLDPPPSRDASRRRVRAQARRLRVGGRAKLVKRRKQRDKSKGADVRTRLETARAALRADALKRVADSRETVGSLNAVPASRPPRAPHQLLRADVSRIDWYAQHAAAEQRRFQRVQRVELPETDPLDSTELLRLVSFDRSGKKGMLSVLLRPSSHPLLESQVSFGAGAVFPTASVHTSGLEHEAAERAAHSLHTTLKRDTTAPPDDWQVELSRDAGDYVHMMHEPLLVDTGEPALIISPSLQPRFEALKPSPRVCLTDGIIGATCSPTSPATSRALVVAEPNRHPAEPTALDLVLLKPATHDRVAASVLPIPSPVPVEAVTWSALERRELFGPSTTPVSTSTSTSVLVTAEPLGDTIQLLPEPDLFTSMGAPPRFELPERVPVAAPSLPYRASLPDTASPVARLFREQQFQFPNAPEELVLPKMEAPSASDAAHFRPGDVNRIRISRVSGLADTAMTASLRLFRNLKHAKLSFAELQLRERPVSAVAVSTSHSLAVELLPGFESSPVSYASPVVAMADGLEHEYPSSEACMAAVDAFRSALEQLPSVAEFRQQSTVLGQLTSAAERGESPQAASLDGDLDAALSDFVYVARGGRAEPQVVPTVGTTRTQVPVLVSGSDVGDVLRQVLEVATKLHEASGCAGRFSFSAEARSRYEGVLKDQSLRFRQAQLRRSHDTQRINATCALLVWLCVYSDVMRAAVFDGLHACLLRLRQVVQRDEMGPLLRPTEQFASSLQVYGLLVNAADTLRVVVQHLAVVTDVDSGAVTHPSIPAAVEHAREACEVGGSEPRHVLVLAHVHALLVPLAVEARCSAKLAARVLPLQCSIQDLGLAATPRSIVVAHASLLQAQDVPWANIQHLILLKDALGGPSPPAYVQDLVDDGTIRLTTLAPRVAERAEQPVEDKPHRVVFASVSLLRRLPNLPAELSQLELVERDFGTGEDVAVSERKCVVCRDAVELAGDQSAVEALINELAVLSLKYDECLMVLYTGGERATLSGATVFPVYLRLVASLTARFPMRVLLQVAFDTPQLVRAIVGCTPNTPARFVTPQLSSDEAFLASFPCLNVIAAQRILYDSGVSVSSLVAMDEASLRAAVPWLSPSRVARLHLLCSSAGATKKD